jgi:hypothetical protein
MSGCGLGPDGWVAATGYATGSRSTKPIMAVLFSPAGKPPTGLCSGFSLASAPALRAWCSPLTSSATSVPTALGAATDASSEAVA